MSEDVDLHLVELKLWMISLMPQECTDYLVKLFGAAYNRLSNNEQIILGTAYLEGAVTNTRLQSMLDLHSIDIGHILAGLVGNKMLIPDRKGRWTSYHLNEEYVIQPEQMELTDIQTNSVSIKNDTDKAIYNYIRANGFITANQVLGITRINTQQGANVALGRLIKADLVVMVRKGRHVIYQLKGQL